MQRIVPCCECVVEVAKKISDFAKANVAAGSIFELLDRVPTINNNTEKALSGGIRIVNDNYDTEIRFEDVDFSYPTREAQHVFKKFNMTVQKGQNVALVGPSGCGKSTIVSLLERFYDPNAGHIRLNGYSLNELNLPWLRSQIGLVSQEPILFDATIAENIAYGDNSRQVTMNEITAAAVKANAHGFISKLPEVKNIIYVNENRQLKKFFS